MYYYTISGKIKNIIINRSAAQVPAENDMRASRSKVLSIVFSVVSGVLILAIIAGALAIFGSIFRRSRGDINYNDIEYSRPDFEEIDKAFDDATYEALNGSSMSAVREMNNATNLLNDLIFALTYVNIEYQKDYTDTYWYEEYNALYSQYNKSYLDYYTMLISALDGPNGDTLFDGWSDDEKQDIRDEYETLTGSGSYVEGQEKINDIKMTYNGLTTSGGMGTAVYRDETSAKKYSDKAGELLIELSSVYNEIYSYDYIDYAYSSYGRDYTADEAADMRGYVKEYIGQYVVKLFDDLGADGYLLYITASTQEDLTVSPVVTDFLSSVSSSEAVMNADHSMRDYLTDAYSYMRKYDLYYRSENPNGSTGAFTTYLQKYDMPYLFQYVTGAMTDVTTFVHEFGHFSAYWLSGADTSVSLDVNEVQSQALEMMFMNRYQDLFGNYAIYDKSTDQYVSGSALSDIMVKGDLFTKLLYSVVMGCVMDELQYDVYTYGEQYESGADVTERFSELLNEYGLSDKFISEYSEVLGYDYDYMRYWWATVSHTFESPFYYISYAVSALPAITIYVESTTDFVGAAQKYNYIQWYSKTSYGYSFIDLLDHASVGSPFEWDTYNELSVYFDSLLQPESTAAAA